MPGLPDEVAELHLGVAEDLADAVDGAARDTGGAHGGEPVFGIALAEEVLQDRDEFGAVAHALRVGDEAGVGRQFLAAQQAAEGLVEAVIPGSDDDVAVARLKSLVGDDVGVGVAIALRLLTGNEMVGGDVAEQRDGRLDERDVDVLALAGQVAVVQGGEDGDGGVHARRDIGDRRAEALWLALDLTRYGHQAGFGLGYEVVTGAGGVGAFLAVAADGAVDQTGVESAQVFVAQALPGQCAGTEVLDQHRRLLDEFEQLLLIFRLAEIQRDAVLIAIESQVI